MSDSTLSGLTPESAPAAEDLLYLVKVTGGDRQVQVQNLRTGLPVATEVEKGLQSAADKVLLGQLAAAVAELESPTVQTLESAATLVVPPGVFNIVLTGTTEVTATSGMTDYRLYNIFYPTGAGVTFMGEALAAGGFLQYPKFPA